MKLKTQQALQAAWNNKPIIGDYMNKVAFHKAAKSFAKEIAQDLGLEKGTFEVRTNMGGDGVGGDTCLHTDKFYLNFGTDMPGFLEVLYRTCPDHKTHGQHGPNQWTTYKCIFSDYEGFLSKLRNLQA